MKKIIFSTWIALLVVSFFVPSLSALATNHSTCELADDYVTPVVNAVATDSGVEVSWQKIDHPKLAGYKVVISKDNSSPKYSEDGYMTYITNKDTISYLVKATTKYKNGDFGYYLTPGESYYFSITALYNCSYKEAGNAVLVVFPEVADDNTNIGMSCKYKKLFSDQPPTRDKYWEKLGLDISKHSDIIKYRIKWFSGGWSEWFTTGVDDIDWKDNCGDKYYLGGRNWDSSRPDECSRRVWSYFTDHVHEYYQCSDNNNWQTIKEVTKEAYKPKEHLVDISKKAKLLKNNQLDEILAELKELRSLVREQQAELKYLRSLAGELRSLASEMRSAVQNFVTYGVDENTKRLGEGERAAVIYSYKEAFGKLPNNETELEDAIKIANGRWPSKRNKAIEQRAIRKFQEIYHRLPNFELPSDDAAITIMSYGLRQRAENRNLKSEQQGIGIYHDIFNTLPETTYDWNVMQAITYSGATR